MLPLLLGYLAGSVPFAFLLARRAGVDVRVAGSGNVGAAGVFGVLAPVATASAAAVFVVTVCWTRYGSLGFLAATVALPPFAWLAGAPAAVVSAAAGAGALILFRHRANLRRLCSGTERKMGRRR